MTTSTSPPTEPCSANHERPLPRRSGLVHALAFLMYFDARPRNSPDQMEESIMKGLCSAAVLLLLSTISATAQSLEQTFDQIGSRLEAAQQSLIRPAPTPGMTFQLIEDAPVYTRPDPSARTPTKMDAKAPVILQGFEKGFAKRPRRVRSWFIICQLQPLVLDRCRGS